MSEHASHTMRENSLNAYEALKSARRLSPRQRLIISVLQNSVVPLTEREIMYRLGFSDTNAVRPRVNELLKAGVLQELPGKRDEQTGVFGRRVGIKPGAEV